MKIESFSDYKNLREDLASGKIDLEDYESIKEDVLDDEAVLPDKPDDVNKEKIKVGNLESKFEAPNLSRKVHPLFVKLHNMLCNGYSPIVIIVGKEGKGKSRAALYIADTLHKMNSLAGDFEPKHQVVYRPLDFLFFIKSSSRRAVLFEEANETLNSMDYYEHMNRSVAGVMRTQRILENLYIFVAPEFERLDKKIRQKVDVLIDLQEYRKASVTSYSYKHGRYNGNSPYTFTPYPKWKVPDVDKDIEKEYDSIDRGFKAEYVDNLIEGLLKNELENARKEMSKKKRFQKTKESFKDLKENEEEENDGFKVV